MATLENGRVARGVCGKPLRVPLVLLPLVALIPVGASRAQGAPRPRPAGGAVDLGYVAASGNTRTTTFTLGENLTWRVKPRLVVRQKLRTIYGEAGNTVNANLPVPTFKPADRTLTAGFQVQF